MTKIEWCIKQKRGIELVNPNKKLSEDYIEKAVNSLRAVAVLKENKDWEICSCYYAMYFSVYSILIRIGIKCEIHSCTIEFLERFLGAYFSKESIYLLKKAMDARIDSQYYSDRAISDGVYSKLKERAPIFLVKCKEILYNITEKDIDDIRDNIKRYL